MDSASLTIFVGLNFRGQSLVNYFRAFKFLMVKRELTRFFSVVRNMAEITFSRASLLFEATIFIKKFGRLVVDRHFHVCEKKGIRLTHLPCQV